MAQINQKQLNIPKPRGATTGGSTEAPPNVPTGRTPTKLDIIGFIVGAITIALVALLYTTSTSYWSFAQAVFDSYRNELNLMRDDKYLKLEERMIKLEFLLTTTPTPKP